MRYIITILILVLSGCSVPGKKVYSDKFEVVYSWDIYPTNPHCEFSDPPVIRIDTHYLSNRGAWAYLPDIIRHEEIHGLGLREHCKKRSCLMYYKIDICPIRLFDKALCTDCEAILWR